MSLCYILFAPRKGAGVEFREQFGVSNKRVLLYLGRMITGKRIDYLLETFRAALLCDPTLHLFTVGSGSDEKLVREAQAELGAGVITHFGAITDPEKLGPILTASDLFVLPGYVGLSPLQAFCYDLPAVVFDLATHSPEFQYLSPPNSMVLPENTTPQQLAAQLPTIFQQFARPDSRAGIYESIRHLTIENMVTQFIEGVNFALHSG